MLSMSSLPKYPVKIHLIHQHLNQSKPLIYADTISKWLVQKKEARVVTKYQWVFKKKIESLQLHTNY